MFGLSIVGVFIVVSFSVLTATFAVDWCLNKGHGCFGMPTIMAAFASFAAVMIAAAARSNVLDDYEKLMPFENPLALKNNTGEAILVKVRAETLCVSKTFEAVLQPDEVAYFSSSSGGYCVLNVLEHDGSRLDSKYEKLVHEEENAK